MHPCLLIVEGFPTIPRMQQKVLWFGRSSQHDKHNKQNTSFFINKYFLKKWRNIMFLQMFHPQTCAILFVTNWCNSTILIYLQLSVVIHNLCSYNVNSSTIVLGSDVMSTYRCNTPSKAETPFSFLDNRCNLI
jgi:hypothetical protein